MYFCGCLIVGLGNGVSPFHRQAITWTNDEMVILSKFDLREHILFNSKMLSFSLQ